MRFITAASVAFLVGVGCAATPPSVELVNARRAYARVSSGPASQSVPDEVHKARTALNTAEKSFADDPKGRVGRDLAYIAERKAQLAEAKGEIARSGKDQSAADHAFKQTLSDQKDRATADAAHSRQQAASSEDQRRNEAAEHATAIDALKVARIQAETREQALRTELALLGQLREEARGTVITLSGDVIFASNKWDLLPSAQARLDRLASALKTSSHQTFVEGHTDSRGTEKFNQELSSRRAASVRDYLVSRGVAADRIHADGFGLERPIADNGTAEGRAMNRRVEIIVEGMRTAQK
jgi:outer membrane protein OmpA-like peptidoglycan-associated protein